MKDISPNQTTAKDRAARLDALLARVDRDAVASRAAALPGIAEDAETLRAYLDTYLNEARVGLDLAAPYLDQSPAPCILEIGSGIGVLTQFLAADGFEITGLEPGAAAGFGFMSALGQMISEELALTTQTPALRGRRPFP